MRRYLIYFPLLFLMVSCEIIEEDISGRAVTTIAPADDAEVPAGETLFRWRAVDRATGYELCVATEGRIVADTLLAADTLGLARSYGCRLRLEAGRYEWTVAAFNSGYETSSPALQLTGAEEPLAGGGEELPIEEKALKYLAKSADGAMRDAWSLLDQCLAFHFGHELTYDMVLDVLGAVDTSVFSKLLRCVIARDVAGCIGVLEEIVLQGRDMSQFVSDFTWYLRNLLLVKTSGDSCEEVIDISSENLARLKEEAQQIEVDAIMRDIRCFSELSGRIRYAGQKRVLIEMALIRLCRPEMETNEDTLLERIRKLEQTVEQIESGSIAVAAVPTGQPAVQGAAPGRKAELPKAVPEEIKEIVAKWPRVAGSAQQPMKSYLKNARLSLGGDNRLLLVVEDGLASDYFTKEPANKGALEQLLAELTGRQIEVEVRSVRSKQEMESSYVDLTRVIHMDIEEE